MQAEELRALQEPIKHRYRENPETAKVLLRASGEIDVGRLVCHLETPHGSIHAGLHPAAGGSGHEACSGEMLLESLIACAGVTLSAVATAMSIPITRAHIEAEGDMDFRGTLGIDRQTQVGITAIRLAFRIESQAPQDQIDKLLQLTERYCVIFQTLKHPIEVQCRRDVG